MQNKVLWRAVPLLFWMGVIFYLSSIPGSGSGFDPPLWYILERKSAHVFEFLLLSVFAFRFFWSWFFPREHWKWVLVLSLTFAYMYGSLDELHQAFVFGRGSHFSDVLIDMLGASFGMGIVSLFFIKNSLRRYKRVL